VGPEVAGRNDTMGKGDKVKNKAQKTKGKTKEKIGDATGSKRLRAEGLADQGRAGIKNAGESAKDTVKDDVNDVKNVKDAVKKR
jgi:uncharacterized protein YjbJ (UPF0337 family)